MTDQELAINWLRDFSIETWDRICFTRTMNRGKVYEVTLTQNLVFQLYQQFHSQDLPFELWEALDERANGNDLELAIETPKGYMLVPCQAKIIKENLRYEELNHFSAGTMQIDSLLAYAKRHEAFPVYILYNYCNDWQYNNSKWGDNYDELSSNGCSIVSAQYLYDTYRPLDTISGMYRWKIPSFQDLHPTHGIPLYLFVALLLRQAYLPFERWRYHQLENGPRFYSYEELDYYKKWDNLTPPPRLSGIKIKPEIDYLEPSNIDHRPFNPRFRIIIPQAKHRTKIVELQ